MFVEQMNVSLNAIVWTHESWIALYLSRIFLCLVLAGAGFSWLMYSDHVHMLSLTGMWEGGVRDLYLERCFTTICSSHFSLCFCSFLSLLLDCQLPEGRSHQFSSVAQSCPTLCNPMDCSTLGFPVHHQLLELAQTHSIESVMPSNHLILCHPLLLLSSIFPRLRCFFNESVLHIRWPKYGSFSFSISSSNKYSGLISFRMDWFDLLAVQVTLKSLLQHHSSKPSILWCSAFFIVQLSHPYVITGKAIALTR